MSEATEIVVIAQSVIISAASLFIAYKCGYQAAAEAEKAQKKLDLIKAFFDNTLSINDLEKECRKL